ncbi:MAG: helix-turn-helix domain-containing protein [Bacilli bacterium]|nr:helix-turn-helix domain-containing protein [Bacilli bacterium]
MSMELGERLAKLRKKAGLSQEQLADELGVSRQAVSRWETGEAAPDTENLIALADIYNISLDELVRAQKGENHKKESKAERVEVVDGIVVDPNPKPDHGGHGRFYGVFYPLFSLACLVAYLILGFNWKMPDGGAVGWASMWTLLFLPEIVGSFVRAIFKRRITAFNITMLVVMVYVGMGIIGNFYGQNFWHPYWAEFFVIPVFYSVASFADGRVSKD